MRFPAPSKLIEPIKNEFVPSELTALEACDEDSIAAPGFIQPHGVLILLQKPHLEILQVSANTQEFWGIAPEMLLGESLEILFDSQQVQNLITSLAEGSLKLSIPFELATLTEGNFRGVFYALEEDLLLELEPPQKLI